MILTKETILCNGFEDNGFGGYGKVIHSRNKDGEYLCQGITFYETTGGFLVEAVSGEEIARVKTVSVERANTIISLLNIKYRLTNGTA